MKVFEFKSDIMSYDTLVIFFETSLYIRTKAPDFYTARNLPYSDTISLKK